VLTHLDDRGGTDMTASIPLVCERPIRQGVDGLDALWVEAGKWWKARR
jgi:hypothetical protein